MYIQITTKCNMTCAHCGYSCNKNGKHMEPYIWERAISMASRYDDEMIAIGGGEPTLHPDFFQILKMCLYEFRYVWMATNGSRTKSMKRLANILDNECDDGEEIYLDEYDKLTVALSLDHYHSPINEDIENHWERRVKQKISGYEVRNVAKYPDSISNQGRAKRTGEGSLNHCICSDLFINPAGKIKLCGCKNAKVIGDVFKGIDPKWKKFMREDKDYNLTCCSNGV